MAATLFGLFAMTTQAQPTAVAGNPPGPTVPTALVYRSAFAGYRPYADQPVKAWRESNDAVGRIGGWREYAKETRETPPASATPADTASQPKVDGGHQRHHGGRP